MIGMLWFDNSHTALAEKITRAADYYRNKYGAAATVVFVNPSDLAPVQLAGLEVKPSRQVMKNHLWLGQAVGS